ncbi:hypothetical protein [Vibrio sinaloensis]|uniref:hypothetical protein n=1 Tax=Photobacterium sp. (strain ATCC 43367) TaxID=379097 RepID=UPI0022AF2DBB|nr:hypothetical protein [Vibrio sinaloensis]MCZ4294239.1 hypothetical protein [Vibrio sinaloensis]
MAAEKLTRGRFVQIIIMLTLLITAFIWRTITFSDGEIIDCRLKTNCTFTVNGNEFAAKRTKDRLLINKSATDLKIIAPDNSVKVLEDANMWVIEAEKLEDLELNIVGNTHKPVATIRF